MIITIDTKLFETPDLTIAEVVYLYLSYKAFNWEAGKFIVNKYLTVDNLIKNSYLDLELNVTQKTINLFNPEDFDKQWEEFKKEYPKQTPGGRLLHNQMDACKTCYYNIVNNDTNLHNHIIRCLKQEKVHRGTTGQMEYFKDTVKYLTMELWKNYEDMLNKQSNTNEQPFIKMK